MKYKITIQLIVACSMTIVGAGLLISGFLIPPVGEIHNSVLIAAGEILTFVGSILGIDYNYKYKVKINANKKENEDDSDRIC